MASRLTHKLYLEDLEKICALPLGWDTFDGARIMISGATGMIGTFLTDTLLHNAANSNFNCEVIALGRSATKASERLPYFDNPNFSFEEVDISYPEVNLSHEADIVIHLASTTHPKAYATQPIGTITSNIVGLQNLLAHAGKVANSKFVFASSVEVYGENRGDTESFTEDYCGYIDSNTLRAGYPEAKRLGEALCQAFTYERGQEVYIPRLPRTFGPTVLPSDTKAISQFIAKAVASDNIVLKSEGTQIYSYLYVADVVSGLLWMLGHGLSKEAYNLADANFDISLRGLAAKLASLGGAEVVFELPDETESAGYSTATRATMDGAKLVATGWQPIYALDETLERTVLILQKMREG